MINEVTLISQQLKQSEPAVRHTLELLEHGATIPFIARYRKESTGEMDEVMIMKVKTLSQEIQALEERRTYILEKIKSQDKLTPELKRRIVEATALTTLEDLYLPYKTKTHTRAEKARHLGLEPLATMLLTQRGETIDQSAARFISKACPTLQDAITGAQDIVAEWVNENERCRALLRLSFQKQGCISAKVIKGKETEGEKYQDYFDFSQGLNRLTGYRYLALKRGQKDKFLRLKMEPYDEKIHPKAKEDLLSRLQHCFSALASSSTPYLNEAIVSGYQRLLKPSIETEHSAKLKLKADDEAIAIYKENLKQLLLAPPLSPKQIMGIDPGYRSGCKVVCLSKQGELLTHTVIYPHPPQNGREKAAQRLKELVQTYHIEVIAIGNGTAGRETEQFLKQQDWASTLAIYSVNEDGASIYSASEIAREEFPTEDITVRGAVSIARRLIDPLSELVKIDPKALGIGQYQYDVNQTRLKESLDQTIEHCVNTVGVELNTASQYLLRHVSGLGPTIAQNIVEYRTKNGLFTSRKQLLKVPKLGPKAFEQCAGFLRLREAKNPLDRSAVHPESYAIVEKMAKVSHCTLEALMHNPQTLQALKLEDFVTSKVGLPTLKDIVKELEKPGRDPRTKRSPFAFDDTITTLNDLKIGMELPAIVRNITNFGAFVDLGIKENGLIHISKMSARRIASPTEVLHLMQEIRVTILDVDRERKRIQLQLVY